MSNTTLKSIKENVATILGIDSVNAEYIRKQTNVNLEGVNLRTKAGWQNVYDQLTQLAAEEQGLTDANDNFEVDSTADKDTVVSAPSKVGTENNTNQFDINYENSVCSSEPYALGETDVSTPIQLTAPTIGYMLAKTEYGRYLFFIDELGTWTHNRYEATVFDSYRDTLATRQAWELDATIIRENAWFENGETLNRYWPKSLSRFPQLFDTVPFELLAVCFFTLYIWVLMFGLFTTVVLLSTVLFVSYLVVKYENKIYQQWSNLENSFWGTVNPLLMGLTLKF